jgi:hypothetical protein
MRKILCTVAAMVAGVMLFGQAAQAQSRVVIGPFDLGDARIVTAGVIAGGAMTGAYFAIDRYRPLKVRGDGRNFSTGGYALTTVGCMTLAPMIAAAFVWHTEQRPLTHREALGLGAGCILPIIGPALWDAAYDANPDWPGR